MSTHDTRSRGGRPEAATPRWGQSSAESAENGARSMPDLLRQLSGESGNLVRQEVALAKAEMREKLAVFMRSMASIAIGGALLLAALMTGLWALNMGLTSLLAQAMDLEIAAWLSPLILTIALGAAGWMMIGRGKSAMADEGLTPRATKETLKEDTRWAQTKAREVKEEMTHGR
jgi:hypothetical protein